MIVIDTVVLTLNTSPPGPLGFFGPCQGGGYLKTIENLRYWFFFRKLVLVRNIEEGGKNLSLKKGGVFKEQKCKKSEKSKIWP